MNRTGLVALVFLNAATAASASADLLRCWKPHPFVYRARYWVEIVPAGGADRFRLEYGTGTESGLSEVQFVESVRPTPAGGFRDADGTTELSFEKARNGRFELRVRDRANGGKAVRIAGFRCSSGMP